MGAATEPITTGELCCGMGGFGTAAEVLQWRTLYAIDNDKEPLCIYTEAQGNIGDRIILNRDITDET